MTVAANVDVNDKVPVRVEILSQCLVLEVFRLIMNELNIILTVQ